MKFPIAWLLAGLLAIPASAGTAEPPPDRTPARWAVVVGVSDYADERIPDLKFAAEDARDIGRALLATPGGGYTESTVVVLAGSGDSSPTQQHIQDTIKSLQEKVYPADSVMIYFSGHGVDVEGRAYLLASETAADRIAKTGLALEDLLGWLFKFPCRTKMLILDACHSGQGSEILPGKMTSAMRDSLEARSSGLAILASSTFAQASYESADLGRGVFSYYLSQAIRGAEGVDRDGDGQLSFEEVAQYVQRRLSDWGRERQLSQTPWLIRSGTAAPPILVNLSPAVYEGARRLDTEVVPSIRLRYQIRRDERGNSTVQGSISVTGSPWERVEVRLIVHLRDGRTLSRPIAVTQNSPLTVVPVWWHDSEIERVELENKVWNVEKTRYASARPDCEREH